MNIQELIDKGTLPQNIVITIHVNKQPDEELARCFNLPTSSEIPILLPNQDRGSQDSHTVVCTYRAQGGGNHTLQHFRHPQELRPTVSPDPFPVGTDGFHLGISQFQGQGTITAKHFYAYVIMMRANSFNIMHYCNRLFQQYCVDMWANIETGYLEYLCFNQDNLRAEIYSGLQDVVHAGDADCAGLHMSCLPLSLVVYDLWLSTTMMPWPLCESLIDGKVHQT